MKKIRKVAAILLAVCVVLGQTGVFAAAEAPAYEYTWEDFEAVGTYSAAILDTVDVTVYGFTPDAGGVYTITTSTAGVTLHAYSGSAYFLVYGGAGENNTVTIECKDAYVGNTFFFGVSGSGTSATVTIALDENASLSTDPTDLPWTYYETSTELEEFTLPGTVKYVDVTEPHSAVLGSDGYYHLDSAAGEILFVNLGGTAPYIQLTGMAEYGQVRCYYYDENGNFLKKVDYNDCVNEYAAYADKGIYPMTSELAEIMQSVGGALGWYDEDRELGGYLFDEVSIDKDTGWMCNACYVPGYGVTEVLYGDVNGDGSITVRDLALLRKYLANKDPETGESTVEVAAGADANGDDGITVRDLAMLRKYLANKNPATGESSVVLGPQN